LGRIVKFVKSRGEILLIYQFDEDIFKPVILIRNRNRRKVYRPVTRPSGICSSNNPTDKIGMLIRIKTGVIKPDMRHSTKTGLSWNNYREYLNNQTRE